MLPDAIFVVLHFFYILIIDILKSVAPKLFGENEPTEINICDLGADHRKWAFSDSGQYATTVTELKDVFKWIPFAKYFNKKNMLHIHMYNTVTKKIYEYSCPDFYNTEVQGFYWLGDSLVVIHLDAVTNQVQLRLYEMNHIKKQVKFVRSHNHASPIEGKVIEQSDSLPSMDEIFVDGQAYTAIVSHEPVTHIFLIPRYPGAIYPPKKYWCEYVAHGEEIEDDIGSGMILYSDYPAICGSKLYFMKKIYYSELQQVKYELDKYLCIDLSKLQDVYGTEEIFMEHVLIRQDKRAAVETTMKTKSERKKYKFQVMGFTTNTTTYGSHQFTFIWELHRINETPLIYHLNLDTEQVSIIRCYGENVNGFSVSRHPLGFFVMFSPQLDESNEPFVQEIRHLSRNKVISLKGIAAAKVFFSKQIDVETVKYMKFVLS